MASGNPPQRVLVFGKSQLVLDDTVAALRDLGYAAQATSDFLSDIAGRLDVAGIDLVVFGTQLPPDRKAGLREEISAVSPGTIFIDSLGGIPGLIASCVREAFTADRKDPARAPSYRPGERSILLTLDGPATVKVTVWWRTSIVPPDPKSDSLVLLDGRLAGGQHAVPVPGHVFLPPQRSPESPNLPPAVYATVEVNAAQAGEAIYNFSIAPAPLRISQARRSPDVVAPISWNRQASDGFPASSAEPLRSRLATDVNTQPGAICDYWQYVAISNGKVAFRY